MKMMLSIIILRIELFSKIDSITSRYFWFVLVLKETFGLATIIYSFGIPSESDFGDQ